MKRKAKNKISYGDLIEYILEDFEYDSVPDCKCPVPQFAHYMPITFCATKCESICWRFRRFIYVYNKCDDGNCDWENPCTKCLDKVKEFKDMINQYRAIFEKYQKDVSVNRKCRIMAGYSQEFEETINGKKTSKETLEEPDLEEFGSDS
jgi:hypothetical protein